jgi:DNA adenine methylase
MSDYKSFLKWAGGKIKLLPKLRELGIESGDRYLEPFVGSGVVALNMPHEKIIIGDANSDLIALWSSIKSAGDKFISSAERYFTKERSTEENYYKIRDLFNSFAERSDDEPFLAEMFLYLNKHCFNGLCRYNANGNFNVPYGHRKTAPGFPKKELEHACKVSKRMLFPQECSFDALFGLVKKDDMVYCDPPYLPLTETSFTDYTKEGFGFNDHVKLRDLALVAKANKATVIISNNDTPVARKLYEGADEIHFIDVRKNISCKGDGRGKQSEIIAVYRP